MKKRLHRTKCATPDPILVLWSQRTCFYYFNQIILSSREMVSTISKLKIAISTNFSLRCPPSLNKERWNFTIRTLTSNYIILEITLLLNRGNSAFESFLEHYGGGKRVLEWRARVGKTGVRRLRTRWRDNPSKVAGKYWMRMAECSEACIWRDFPAID